nr:hypothetical protein [Desulfurispira natronophila]
MELYRREMQRGRPHHAYLVGSGSALAVEFALYFLRGLNCLGPVQGCLPCGDCYCCKHDYMVSRQIEPEDGHISIDQIRDLAEFLDSTSVDGQFRCKGVIIEQAEKMTSTDAVNRTQENALLKTLEEPPVGSVLFLLSDVPSFFLPTIRSRTAFLPFYNVEMEEYRRHLGDLQFSQNEIQLLSKIADTSCTERRDLEFIVQCVAVARGLLKGSLEAEQVQFYLKNADQWERMLRVFHVYFRDALIFLQTGKHDRVYKIVPCNPYRVIEILQDIGRVRRILSTTHSNPRFQMLSLLSKHRCQTV